MSREMNNRVPEMLIEDIVDTAGVEECRGCDLGKLALPNPVLTASTLSRLGNLLDESGAATLTPAPLAPKSNS